MRSASQGAERSDELEQRRENFAGLAEPKLVELRGVLGLLEPDVDGPDVLSPSPATPDGVDESRRGIDGPGAPDADEEIAREDVLFDGGELERYLPEPHDVRPHARPARAAREVLRSQVERFVHERLGRAPWVLAAALRELAVHVHDAARACRFVQPIHVLSAQEEAFSQVRFERRERMVRGVWPHAGRLRPALRIEAPDERRIISEALGRRDLLEAMLLPEPVRVAKGANATLGADPRAGQDEHAHVPGDSNGGTHRSGILTHWSSACRAIARERYELVSSRRSFLKALGVGVAVSAVPRSVERALSIPARKRTGTLRDIEHIVILMQENRSFDHYFGTLWGVRGFGDPRAVCLPGGNSVFEQPHGASPLLPFRPPAPNLGLTFLEDLPHDWADTHAAWRWGKYDAWVTAKGTSTMAHLTRQDLPFHFALADAFTVCDAYYCSVMGATDPNRHHLFAGFTGNGSKAGPVLDNTAEGYDFHTYPERLSAAGISWKVYQDAGEGLDEAHGWGWAKDPYTGNYGGNSLLYFRRYQVAPRGSVLHDAARSATCVRRGGSLFDLLQRDVERGELPQVSWIVAPEAYSEHPNWPANYGAWYISRVLDVLTSNEAVWGRTALFLTYDENDGFFDHMVPPTPPASREDGLSTIDTVNELFEGGARHVEGPIGLGMRVPMIVISPFSRGGFVNSEVFDHTSLIRFIEQRFADRPGLFETNITPWRRAVTGDLTSAFDFASPNDTEVVLPSTHSFVPPDAERHASYSPRPSRPEALPRQELGLRKARPLPYSMHVTGSVDFDAGALEVRFDNDGKRAVVFQARTRADELGPWTYTVGSGQHLLERFALRGLGRESYDLSVYGPNGFFRAFQGTAQGGRRARIEIHTRYDRGLGIVLTIQNRTARRESALLYDAYTRVALPLELAPESSLTVPRALALSHGWYDLSLRIDSDGTFFRRLAGHVETGELSTSDPLLASALTPTRESG